MTKRLLCIIVIVLAVACVLVSCGDNSKSNDNNNTTSISTDNTTNDTENSGSGSHTHDYEEWETVKAATCTAEGTKERYCSCGEKQTATIMATGHSFGEWKTVKESTTTEKGLQERACACGEKETRDLDKLSVVTTITKQQWKSFLDFSKLSSFTITANETGFYDENLSAIFNLVAKSYNGLTYVKIIGTDSLSGEVLFEEESYETNATNPIYYIGGMGFDHLHTLVNEFWRYDDYYFSNLVYSNEDKSYSFKDTPEFKFWFENGILTKYTYTDDELTSEYIISDINTTDMVDVPINKARNTLQEALSTLSEASVFDYWFNNKLEYDTNVILNQLSCFIVTGVERYHLFQEGEHISIMMDLTSDISLISSVDCNVTDGKITYLYIEFGNGDTAQLVF
ncbi:MAG: hypothetical protein E7596_03895 [Ruminococcaceae bacterium]|nr:hypothetical protein [Oscillospiraceae bacterium]